MGKLYLNINRRQMNDIILNLPEKGLHCLQVHHVGKLTIRHVPPEKSQINPCSRAFRSES